MPKNLSTVKLFGEQDIMRRLTGLIALVFVIFLTLAQPAFSLDWNDKEWVKAQCPENISGQWLPRSVASVGGPIVTVSNHQFIFTSKTGETNKINFETLSESSRAIVLELDAQNLSANIRVLPYLKIRPHLAKANDESSVHNTSQVECLIKVFRYQSQEKIQHNQYINWDIYQIKNRN